MHLFKFIFFQDSFEAFINQRQNKPAEMIAKFVDSKVCKKNNNGIFLSAKERAKMFNLNV